MTRVLVLAASVTAAMVATAGPAAAHGLGGLQPTNYETRVLRVSPRPSGLTIEVVDVGTRLRVTNTAAHDVVVLGYDDEPYLRVGPRGAFENTRSPAVTLNRSTTATGALPPSADSDAPPRWRRVSSGHSVSWHDHRAHWMASEDPPSVRRDPDRRHRVQTWKVTLDTPDGAVTARGDVVWVPGPSPWPLAALAVAAAAGVFVLTRTRRWWWSMVGALGALVGLEALHLAGAWGASAAGTGTRVSDNVYSIAGVLVGAAALVWLARRRRDDAAPAVLVAAVVLVAVGGLTDLTVLGHSQLPSTFDAGTARLVVALVLGIGGGLVAGAGARLRLPPP